MVTTYESTLLPTEINVRELKRVHYQDKDKPGWNRINYMDAETKTYMVAIAREGAYAHFKLTVEQFNVLIGCSSTQAVQAKISHYKLTDDLNVASLMVQYFMDKPVNFTISNHSGAPIQLRVLPHYPHATPYRDWETDRKSTRLNSSHRSLSRMPSSA